MNKEILKPEVQEYINTHLQVDVHQLAMAKSPFNDVTAQELASQITAKNKAEKKLPSWYHKDFIYYPTALSIEQTSSEKTAAYKAELVGTGNIIDITGGFGVDSFYFAQKAAKVIHCEINEELSGIAAHNASILGADRMSFLATDGIAFLQETEETFDTIYIDPARRSELGKVFMLKDCTPNVVGHMDLLLSKGKQVIIKTSPLLDLSAGLKELKHVKEVHIVSTKNECKELLFVLDNTPTTEVNLICVTINDTIKKFKMRMDQRAEITFADRLRTYIYEPDVALLKSGGFNVIAEAYGLEKLHEQTQLYTADLFKPEFPGRIFNVEEMMSSAALKKEKNIRANIIVRSYPDKPAQLAKKYNIKPAKDDFLIFTKTKIVSALIIKAKLLQFY
ncbi:16S rRNA G966 N2-methylase RsmD [Pedobacter sp. CAN_A7]|uniref:THUMP-like domain-containing protein n=1 Tax=Pedobacter sp. CAN_A7 TaxID=2787722 RepID=UPI0018C8E083